MQWMRQLGQKYMSSLMSICVSSGHQEGQDFSFVIPCDSVAKNKANSRVLRSSIVVHSKELFMRDSDRD